MNTKGIRNTNHLEYLEVDESIEGRTVILARYFKQGWKIRKTERIRNGVWKYYFVRIKEKPDEERKWSSKRPAAGY